MSVPVTVYYHVIDDITPPTAVHSISPSGWTNGSVTINVIATDDRSGVKSITLPNGQVQSQSNVNYTVTENGNYVFKLEDMVGNKKDYLVTITNIDKTGPSYTMTQQPTSWVIDTVSIHWAFQDTQSGYKQVVLPNGVITKDVSGAYTVTQNGEYTFVAYDNVGNTTTVTKSISNIDTTAPTGTLTPNITQWTTNEVTISWEFQDSQSGFDYVILPNSFVSYQAKGSLTVKESGIYTFLAYDKVGNMGIFTITISNIDSQAPDLEISQEIEQWTNEDILLHWKASDYQSGLREVISPDSVSNHIAEGNYTAMQNGFYTFIAYDTLGNEIIRQHEVTNIDKDAPTVTLEKKVRGDKVYIHWNVTDNQSGLRELVLPTGERTLQQEGEFSVPQNGIYRFIAYDKVGNVREISITVNEKYTIDFSIKLTKETQDWTMGPMNIYWKIENAKEFSQIVLPDGTFCEQTEGSYRINENGKYIFIAYDNYGNRIQQEIIVTTIDSKVPNLLIQQENDTWVNDTIQIHWKSEDEQSGIRGVLLPDGRMTEQTEGTYCVTSNGNYLFIVYDNAGNEVRQQIKIEALDKEPPTLELFRIESDKIQWKAQDNQSGIAKIVLPNGKETMDTEGIYEVKIQGQYCFIVYDHAGNETRKEIRIE